MSQRVLSRLCAIVVLCAATPVAAQDPANPPFSCEAGAVELIVDRNPGLSIVPLATPPRVPQSPSHEFTFTGAPLEIVRVYLGGTIGEEIIGRASAARLSIYLETARHERTPDATQWWQVLPTTPADRPAPVTDDRTPRDLLFDARSLGRCFIESEQACAFADVSAASNEPNVPLIVIGFRQDLGGANADNWTDARLLLDFRTATPRVAVTADCSYNEGGGACTAIESGQMMRSALSCSWAPDANDFLCTEQRDNRAHRDFYLLSDRRPPNRPDEVDSMPLAATRLATSGKIGDSVTARGLGPVTWIGDVTLDPQRRLMLLASEGSFYSPRPRALRWR